MRAEAQGKEPHSGARASGLSRVMRLSEDPHACSHTGRPARSTRASGQQWSRPTSTAWAPADQIYPALPATSIHQACFPMHFLSPNTSLALAESATTFSISHGVFLCVFGRAPPRGGGRLLTLALCLHFLKKRDPGITCQ